jgi:hypothetical protein
LLQSKRHTVFTPPDALNHDTRFAAPWFSRSLAQRRVSPGGPPCTWSPRDRKSEPSPELPLEVLERDSHAHPLIASSVDTPKRPKKAFNWDLVFYVGALLPWPLALILLVVATMEMRLVRASRWINGAVAPRVTWGVGPSPKQPIIQWEQEPNRYLTGSLAKFKTLTEAWTYAAVIGAPGILGGITGLVGGTITPSQRVALLIISVPGLIALVGMALLVAWISRGATRNDEERRGRTVQPRDRFGPLRPRR